MASSPSSLREQLQRDEGLRLKMYLDALGHPTIGYGRALDTKGISLGEAEYLLDHDILDATSDVIAEFPWAAGLDEVRRAVMVNMAFNLGAQGLAGFTHMLAAVKAGQWGLAADEMIHSQWHQQVGVRAERLAEQMR